MFKMMKYLFALLLLIPSSVFADEEFCCGDRTYFEQDSSDPAAKDAYGGVRQPAGTCTTMGVGVGPKKSSPANLKISDTEVRLHNITLDNDVLSGESRQKFLASKIVTLSSGRGVQFFREWNRPSGVIVIYLANGRLLEIVRLTSKELLDD